MAQNKIGGKKKQKGFHQKREKHKFLSPPAAKQLNRRTPEEEGVQKQTKERKEKKKKIKIEEIERKRECGIWIVGILGFKKGEKD